MIYDGTAPAETHVSGPGRLTLPSVGGNIVLLTQLYWPTVHPAMQEPRR